MKGIEWREVVGMKKSLRIYVGRTYQKGMEILVGMGRGCDGGRWLGTPKNFQSIENLMITFLI